MALLGNLKYVSSKRLRKGPRDLRSQDRPWSSHFFSVFLRYERSEYFIRVCVIAGEHTHTENNIQ